ncbi:MAG: NfeD family protein [Ruminococcus flavefaciens]|nr:NfeD family protein [Ruminococcus flavefaciens]HQM00778.1 NfeD family protein [Ruminococcus flavefaciens]
MEVLFWALTTLAFIIAEVITIQLVSIWFAAGAFITMIFAYFKSPGFVGELIIFIVSSALLLIITYPLLKNWRHVKHVGTNSELEIGKTASVIETVDGDKGTGRVKLNGVDWSAVSVDGNDIIPVGTIVTVVRVQGAKLFVTSKT